jgi:hypothetical protein
MGPSPSLDDLLHEVVERQPDPLEALGHVVPSGGAMLSRVFANLEPPVPVARPVPELEPVRVGLPAVAGRSKAGADRAEQRLQVVAAL